MKKIYHSIGIGVFIYLIINELISKYNPLFGKTGAYLWIYSYLYLLIFTVNCLIRIVKNTVKNKAPFALTMIILWLIILFINIPNPKNISGEAAQEVTCALNYLTNTNDLGYTNTCLFGYPSKQHYIQALPSLFFGRSVFSLHLGGSIYFILGIIIFSAGILEYYNNRKYADFISGFILASLFHFNYLNVLLFLFGQAIFPLSLGLIITGIFLHYLKYKSDSILLLLGFCLLYLVFSYTPSLSIYFLSILVIIYHVFDRNITVQHKVFFILMILSTLFAFFLSIKYREDIRLWNLEQRSFNLLVEDVFQGLKHLLFQSNGDPFNSIYYQFIFISVIISSILLIFGWQVSILAIWMIGVIILSIVSKGYTYFGVDFRVHRAIVILPMFFGVIAYISRKINLESRHRYLFGVFIVILLTGYYYHASILDSRQINPQYLLMVWLKNNIRLGLPQDKKNVYFVSDAIGEFGSFNNYTNYFIPQLNGSIYSLTDCEISEITKGVYIIKQSDECLYYFERYMDKKIGIFSTEYNNYLVYESV